MILRHKKLRRIAAAQRQLGLTLIELMVAITISAVLLLSMVEIFTSSKQTFRTQEALSHLQESARFTRYYLSYIIRQAGYRSQLNSTESSVFAGQPIVFGQDNAGNTASVEDASGAIALNDVASGTDIIAIRYQGNPDNLTGHCLSHRPLATSTAVTNTDVATNVLFIKEDRDTGLRSLSCKRRVNAQNDNEQPLVTGVEDLQILYGVDTTGSNPLTINQYLPADQVADWNNVLSVRLTLTLNGASSEVNQIDGNRDRLEDFGSILQRRVTTVVTLRNRQQITLTP